MSSDASVAKAYLILKGLTASWVHDYQTNGKQNNIFRITFFSDSVVSVWENFASICLDLFRLLLLASLLSVWLTSNILQVTFLHPSLPLILLFFPLSYLTLPYLTLPYLTLPSLTLPYLTSYPLSLLHSLPVSYPHFLPIPPYPHLFSLTQPTATPISESILSSLYRYLCGYGDALLSDPALHRIVYGIMTKLFKRLISALKQLGARIVHASFSNIIIHTDKEVRKQNKNKNVIFVW